MKMSLDSLQHTRGHQKEVEDLLRPPPPHQTHEIVPPPPHGFRPPSLPIVHCNPTPDRGPRNAPPPHRHLRQRRPTTRAFGMPPWPLPPLADRCNVVCDGSRMPTVPSTTSPQKGKTFAKNLLNRGVTQLSMNLVANNTNDPQFTFPFQTKVGARKRSRYFMKQ